MWPRMGAARPGQRTQGLSKLQECVLGYASKKHYRAAKKGSSTVITSGRLFPDDDDSDGTVAVATKAALLTSVWEGNDGELIEEILRFYPTIKPHPILDSTYNAGRMWKNSKRKVASMAIDPQHKPMILCGDWVVDAAPVEKAWIGQ